MSTGTPKDLVIGLATGYAPEDLSPFVVSLRRSGYSGAVVLFLDRDLRARFRTDADRFGVTLIAVPRWRRQVVGLDISGRLPRLLWRYLRGGLWLAMELLRRLPLPPRVRLALQTAVAERLYFPTSSRFFRYRKFLDGDTFQRILLTDVRDVLFQADPFAHMPQTGLALSLETAAYTLASEPHNALWLGGAYGDQMLVELGAQRVSCAGVTYGDIAAIRHYLDLMIGQIAALPLRKVRLAGLDQAMHNVLLATGRLDPVHLLEPLHSAVATLNGLTAEEVTLSVGGRLTNGDGSEPSVVHQYDRVPGLAEGLLRSLVG